MSNSANSKVRWTLAMKIMQEKPPAGLSEDDLAEFKREQLRRAYAVTNPHANATRRHNNRNSSSNKHGNNGSKNANKPANNGSKKNANNGSMKPSGPKRHTKVLTQKEKNALKATGR